MKSSKSTELVSVLIVTAGKYTYLASCLQSLKEQTFSPFEIMVIDNGPCNKEGVPVCVKDAGAAYQANASNLYYGKALNIGIHNTRGDFVLCLNDDVILDAYFIENALKGFERSDTIGMVGAKVMRVDRKTVDSTGLFLTYWRSARERGYGRTNAARYNREEFIFGPTGAVGFFRRRMLEDIKEGSDYFDPDFDMFYEDVDIAWRAQKKGWKALYIPGALAFHVRGGSARSEAVRHKGFARDSLSDELYAELIKNRYLLLIKNESVPSFLLHLPGIFAYDCCSWLLCLFKRPGAAAIFLKKRNYLKAALIKRKKSGRVSARSVV